MEIYYNPDATDEEISECFGDYYGCNVCIHKRKCLEILHSKLQSALAESKKGKDYSDDDYHNWMFEEE